MRRLKFFEVLGVRILSRSSEPLARFRKVARETGVASEPVRHLWPLEKFKGWIESFPGAFRVSGHFQNRLRVRQPAEKPVRMLLIQLARDLQRLFPLVVFREQIPS